MNRIAILIDAENVPFTFADPVFRNAQERGTVTVKELYGSGQALSSWNEPALRYAMHPNITLKQTKGKNTSDIALAIGAMDLLAEGQIDTVVIVSSDSDFSSLAVRLRRGGLEVIGMGEEKSNPLWKIACSTFVTLENEPALAPRRSTSRSSRSRRAKAESAPVQEAVTAAEPEPQAEETAPVQEVPRTEEKPHTDDRARIAERIERVLRHANGRVPMGRLCQELGRMKEYQAARKNSGKKAWRYLNDEFPELIRTETVEDSVWAIDVRLPQENEAAAQASVEAAAEEEISAETVTAESAEAEAPAEEAAAAPEPEAEEAPAGAEEEPAQENAVSSEEQMLIDRLIDGGFDAETAAGIASVCAWTTPFRAYNALRKRFGNAAGREYYNRMKELLTANS